MKQREQQESGQEPEKPVRRHSKRRLEKLAAKPAKHRLYGNENVPPEPVPRPKVKPKHPDSDNDGEPFL